MAVTRIGVGASATPCPSALVAAASGALTGTCDCNVLGVASSPAGTDVPSAERGVAVDRKPLLDASQNAATKIAITTAITPINPHGMRRGVAFIIIVTGLMALLAPVARRPSIAVRSSGGATGLEAGFVG